jgi:hypothetical protein
VVGLTQSAQFTCGICWFCVDLDAPTLDDAVCGGPVRTLWSSMLWVGLLLASCLPTTPAALLHSERVVWCGDGYVEGEEVCDDGFNDGRYGHCAEGCVDWGPRCGDGVIGGPEVCDDGVNDGTYGSCAHDCSFAMGWCGDGAVNGPEVCDDGVNDGGYGGCASDCLALGPHCGDGRRHSSEVCDDGINDGSCGSCATDCQDYGTGLFLTMLRVIAIPDTYGYPADFWPDMFLEVTDLAGGEVYVSGVVNNTDPPVTWNVPEVPVEEELLYVHAWDDDGGFFLGADDLGEVQIDTSEGAGRVSAGGLTLDFTVQELSCAP